MKRGKTAVSPPVFSSKQCRQLCPTSRFGDGELFLANQSPPVAKNSKNRKKQPLFGHGSKLKFSTFTI